MSLTAYAKDVSRLGGSARLTHPDGSACNVSHEDFAATHEIQTDGLGNVVEQPLIRRKPCFGRPESFIRRAFDKPRRDYVSKTLGVIPSLNRCHKCPVVEACTDLCIERIESDATIEQALDAFFAIADRHADNRKFKEPNAQRAWNTFLHSIRAHGGWTSINDLRVILDVREKHKERAKKRRESSKTARLKLKLARQGKPRLLTRAILSAIAVERDRRLVILDQVSASPKGPRWVSKLSKEGRCRVVNVWEARTILAREGGAVTGRAAAEWLIRAGKAPKISAASLTTAMLRDFERIQKLERELAGQAIWAEFVLL